MHTSLDIPKLGPKVFIIGNVANEVRLFFGDEIGEKIIHGQWCNDGVAAASSDGGPTGGRGPPTVLEF